MFISDLSLGMHRSDVEAAERELALRRAIAEREEEVEAALVGRHHGGHLMPRLVLR